MAKNETRDGSSKDGREARLKAALKANLARRKAQAKARAADAEDGAETTEKD